MSVGDSIFTTQAVQFLGIEEMKRSFEALPGTLQRRVLRQAVNAGATSLSRAIRKNTPKGKTGNLKRAVKKKPSSKWRRSREMQAQGVIGVAVGHDYSVGPHSHLVEFGHRIKVHNEFTGGKVEGTGYFFKAVNSVSSEVRAKITNKARQALPKAIASHVSKYKSKAAIR